MKQEYLLIGTVLKPQGIHGECKIKSYAADVDSFQRWKEFYRLSDGSFSPLPFSLKRIHDGFVYAVLGNAADMEGAEAFRGCDLYVHRRDTVSSGQNGSLIADLIGCRAIDESGLELGVLTDVLQHGPVDTWVFRTPSGLLMAPALLSVFPVVDVDAGRIEVCSERLQEVAVRED